MRHSCLTADWILAGFGKQRARAQELYRDFVQQGRNQPSPWQQLKNQIYLGSDAFVEDMQCKMDSKQPLVGIPKVQKLAPMKPLEHYRERYPVRNEAMARAYLDGHYSLQAVGEYFGVSYGTVSRAVRAFERQL